MLGVDEGRRAPLLLCLGNRMDGQCGLTAALGTIDLDDASLGIATHAQCGVQAE